MSLAESETGENIVTIFFTDTEGRQVSVRLRPFNARSMWRMLDNFMNRKLI